MTTGSVKSEWWWGTFCLVVMLFWVPLIGKVEDGAALLPKDGGAQPESRIDSDAHQSQVRPSTFCDAHAGQGLRPSVFFECVIIPAALDFCKDVLDFCEEGEKANKAKLAPSELPSAAEVDPSIASIASVDDVSSTETATPATKSRSSDTSAEGALSRGWLLLRFIVDAGLLIALALLVFQRWRKTPTAWISAAGIVLVIVASIAMQEAFAVWAEKLGFLVHGTFGSETRSAGVVHEEAVWFLLVAAIVLAAITLRERVSNVPGIGKAIIPVILLLPGLSLTARDSTTGGEQSTLAWIYPALVYLAMTVLGGISRWRAWPTMLFLALCLLEGVRDYFEQGPSWSAFIVQGSHIDLLDVMKLLSLMLATKFLGLVVAQNFEIVQRLWTLKEKPLTKMHGKAFSNCWPMFVLFVAAGFVSVFIGSETTQLGVKATREAYAKSAAVIVVDSSRPEAGGHLSCVNGNQTLLLNEESEKAVKDALIEFTNQMEMLLLACAKARIERAEQEFGDKSKDTASFIRFLGANMLPRDQAPNANLGCRWYDIGCRLKEWVLRRLRDAYLKASETIRNEADKEADAFEKSADRSIEATKTKLLKIYKDQITNGHEVASSGIRTGFQRADQFNTASWLYAWMVLLQAYLFVLARLIFRTEQPASAELEGRIRRELEDGSTVYVDGESKHLSVDAQQHQERSDVNRPHWKILKQEYCMSEADVSLGWSLRTDLIIEGEHDRLTIPQKGFAMLPRLLARRYRMRRVDSLSWSRSQLFGYTAVTIRTTSPVCLVEFTIPKDASIFFRDLGPLAGFSDSITLETVYSLRITSLLFGQAIFRRATATKTDGRVLFVVTGDPPGGQALSEGAEHRESKAAKHAPKFVFPTGTLVAWDVDEHFKVSAQDSVEDTFFSEHSLRADGSGVLRDQTAGRGFSTAVFRIIRRFLLPL